MDRLPPELINFIHDKLDPLSSLHLALVNRQLAAHSSDALALNRKHHETYLTVSDTDTAATTTLLEDSTVAWHVRTLELSRQADDTILVDVAKLCGYPAATEDAEPILHLMSELTRKFQPWPDVSRQLTHLAGLDTSKEHASHAELLDLWQTLIVLHCPMIRKLKTFLRREAKGNSPGEGYLIAIIGRVAEIPEPVWPASLMSLRQVALGLPSADEDGEATLRSKKILPIFRLPNLETVYIRGLDTRDQGDDDTDALSSSHLEILPERSSSVRHVCLDGGSGGFTNDLQLAISNIILASRELETLVLSSCRIEADFDHVTSHLGRWQMYNIKTFFTCGDVSHHRGYRGALYEETYASLRAQNFVPLDLEELEGFATVHNRDNQQGLNAGLRATLEDIKEEIGDAHTLVLYAQDVVGREFLDWLDEGLASLMTPAGETPDELKTMFLDKTVDALVKREVVEERALAFPKTMEAAARHGHTVHYEEGALDRFAREMCQGMFGVELEMKTLSYWS